MRAVHGRGKRTTAKVQKRNVQREETVKKTIYVLIDSNGDFATDSFFTSERDAYNQKREFLEAGISAKVSPFDER